MREKILKVIILILIVLFIYKIIEINAAYKTAINQKTNSNIGQWVIFVNDVNIATTETKEFELGNIVKQTDNVKEGKIAPGVEFELPIKIDATNTKDIDIRYDITIEVLNEIIPDIKVKEILEKNQNCEIIRTDINTYTGIISKEQIKELINHDVAINLYWENNENNNEIDTLLGTNAEIQKTQVSVTIYISQYGNEEIKAYKEGNENVSN